MHTLSISNQGEKSKHIFIDIWTGSVKHVIFESCANSIDPTPSAYAIEDCLHPSRYEQKPLVDFIRTIKPVQCRPNEHAVQTLEMNWGLRAGRLNVKLTVNDLSQYTVCLIICLYYSTKARQYENNEHQKIFI